MKHIKLYSLLLGGTFTLLAACIKGEQEYTCVCSAYSQGVKISEYKETIKAEERKNAKLACTGMSRGNIKCELE